MKGKPKNSGGGLRPYWMQLKAILLHKWYFFRAGRYLGLPLWRIIVHDLSKFRPVEFINYSRWKYGVQDKAGWAKAWLHHLHANKHHPEHWIVSWGGDPSFYSDIGERIVGNINVLELVTDWMATSKERTGSYDIAVWVNSEGPKRFFHDKTEMLLDDVMCGQMDYFSTDNCQYSYMAGNALRQFDGQEGCSTVK